MYDNDKTLLLELVRGAELTFQNAEQLFSEAVLLRKNGHLNRALFLHQISMEECAKIDILGAWATNLMSSGGVDLAKLTKAIRNHKAKNYTNAYMARLSDAELAARERKDWKGSAEAFKEWQAKIHSYLNTHKNASLYVDFNDGKFLAPDDMITERMVDEIGITNQYFLAVTHPRLGAMRRMADETDAMKAITTWFVDRLKNMNLGEHETAMDALFQEMVERYKRERASQAHEKQDDA